MQPDARGSRPFLESRYRDALAEHLRRGGWLVDVEAIHRTRHGRPDVHARLPGREVRAIEVKAANPVAGVGQALAYALGGHGGVPTLAVPHFLDTDLLRAVCLQAGVDLWVMEVGSRGSVRQIRRVPGYPATTQLLSEQLEWGALP